MKTRRASADRSMSNEEPNYLKLAFEAILRGDYKMRDHYCELAMKQAAQQERLTKLEDNDSVERH